MKKKIDIKLIQKKDLSLKILKEWIYWLNDKEVTKFSNQRFKKHTVSSQKNYLFEKLKKKKQFIIQN